MTAAPENVVAITSPEAFMEIMQRDLNRVTVLNFWAPWAQPCEQMKHELMESVSQLPQVLLMNVEAEEQPDVAESFEVEAVPTVVLLRGHTLLAKVVGANVKAVREALAQHVASPGARGGLAHTNAMPQTAPAQYSAANGNGRAYAPSASSPLEETPEGTDERCRALMNRAKVMLFMKGDPSMPRCGFSQKTVALLRDQKVDFDYYDILSDENVRQRLKVLNEWPTFPQIVVNGELVGGLDIVKEQVASGEFKDLVGA
ncbi:glutaredoxin [Malassezia sp. CBS 17886]|nr:glutaredoxin [Malassezia sp. CBS 17886]